MNTSTTAPPALLAVKEVAERLGSSRMHVLRLIASGRLIAHNIGNGARRPIWRVRQADLDAFIKQTSTASDQRK